MTYEELLRQPEWHDKCYNILKRDGFKCKECGCNGYHFDLIAELTDIIDVDGILNDFLVDGVKLSEFISADMLNRKMSIRPSQLKEESGTKWHGYNLYKCSEMSGGKMIHISTKEKLQTYEEKLTQYKNTNAKFHIDHSLPLKFPNGLNTSLELFESALLTQQLSQKPILTIERIYPTGGVATAFGDSFVWGSIVISITYKNYAASFYLAEKRYYELKESGNIDLSKPIDSPIPAKGLNIHHKYYVKGFSPWEYSDDALITLCQDCHKKTHKKERIPIYRSLSPSRAIDSYAIACSRCDGSGYLPQYHYYYEGVCFKCWGEGIEGDLL